MQEREIRIATHHGDIHPAAAEPHFEPTLDPWRRTTIAEGRGT